MFRPASFRPTRFRPGSWTSRTRTERGSYRVANTSIVGYELYVGEDAAPDLTATPDETSATLPFTHALAAPMSGSTAYNLTTLYRNQYNEATIISARTYTAVEIDSNGDQVDNPPTAPEGVALTASASGAITVEAYYYFYGDGANKADTWRIYATVGSDPDPTMDSPVKTVTMEYLSAVSYLNTSITGYSESDDVRVIVTAYNSSTTVQSTNTTATAVSALADGPSAPNADFGFAGDISNQG